MDIDRVRYFCAFADTGSLVKASDILNISQPALSKALRLLEYEVGMKLIESEGRGLKLTIPGEKFRKSVQPLLLEWLALPQRLNREAVKETPLKIGSFEVFTTHFLGELLHGQSWMNGVEVHELGPGKLEAAIFSGAIDLGITYLPIPTKGVSFTKVSRIRMGVFGLESFKTMASEEVPFVVPLLPLDGAPSKVVGLDGWPDHKYPRRVRFRVGMMESALALCRRGFAVAYLPEFLVKLHNESVKEKYRLTELSSPVLKSERSQDVFFVEKISRSEDSTTRAIAKRLRSLM